MGPELESLLVAGGGGHGKVTADLARTCGYDVTGFVDTDPRKVGKVLEPTGLKVLAEQEAVSSALRKREALPGNSTAIAIGIGDNQVRLRLYVEWQAAHLPALSHPSAVVSSWAQLGPASVVMATASIGPGAVIGAATIVNTGAVVEHDCVLGEGAHVSPGAVLAGGVRIGDRSWVGAGAVIIEGVRIGNDVIVGAGAVVLRDVGDGQTVVGVPARAAQSKAGK